MNIETLQELTRMPRARAIDLLGSNRATMFPTTDQARLEGAIFDRIRSLASGHTPGSVEDAIEFVEPYERVFVIHPGPGLDVRRLSGAVTPSFENGSWANGIPALRVGPSNRGIVLYQEGIDAAVVLAGVTDRQWNEALKEHAAHIEGYRCVTRGPVSPEEAALIDLDRGNESPYGSILVRRIGALYGLPHLGVDMYNRTPGRVLEIVQPARDLGAAFNFTRALDFAGLDLIREESSSDQLTFLPKMRRQSLGQSRTRSDGPLLIRLVHEIVSFPNVGARHMLGPACELPRLAS